MPDAPLRPDVQILGPCTFDSPLCALSRSGSRYPGRRSWRSDRFRARRSTAADFFRSFTNARSHRDVRGLVPGAEQRVAVGLLRTASPLRGPRGSRDPLRLRGSGSAERIRAGDDDHRHGGSHPHAGRHHAGNFARSCRCGCCGRVPSQPRRERSFSASAATARNAGAHACISRRSGAGIGCR
jgi:hypothetical protein